MSEQRKRLTDRDVTVCYEAQAFDLLKPDHLQAREDRKRLAVALRARLVDCCGEPDTTGRCAWCLRDAALLAEADPQ